PDLVRIVALANDRLTLAVIAEAPGFQHRWQADFGDCRAQRGRRRDVGIIGGADAELAHEVLFGEAILRGFEDLAVRQHGTPRCEDHGGRGRHVLEFIGDDVDIGGKKLQRFDIGIYCASRVQHDIEGGRIRVGRKHPAAQPKPGRRHCQHPAQLASAENADGVAGFQLHLGWRRHADSSGRSLTASVCCLRHAASRPASAGSLSARTPAASSAALIAPGLPIASVPTGIPAGICTMEYSESTPDSALDSMGTPNTGSSVSDAVMPGRWAAPPAPAMMILKPAAFAPLAKANSRSGVRCAETMCFSLPTPSAVRVSAVWRMVSQSDWLPMMMAIGAVMRSILFGNPKT